MSKRIRIIGKVAFVIGMIDLIANFYCKFFTDIELPHDTSGFRNTMFILFITSNYKYHTDE